MSGLSEFLTRNVVVPLNEMGIAIDLQGVQAALILTPVLFVVLAFVIAGWKKRQRMKELDY
ncbi:MAG: hypothetical protein OEZ06_31470 [Myxococcales bacterium]|nr:hypothetical protein [Myxococcales bacterium]